MNKIRLIYTTKNLHYEIHLKTSYKISGFQDLNLDVLN